MPRSKKQPKVIRARKAGAPTLAARKRAQRARGQRARVISISWNPMTPEVADALADVYEIAMSCKSPTTAA